MAENGGAPAPAPAVPYMCRDLVYEIMLRLPPADVHRSCRYVCTEWREHVAEGHLIVTHRRTRAPMPLFFYRRDFSLGPVNPGENPGLARVDLQAVDLAARESRRVLRFADVLDPMADADGLGFDELDPNADTGDLGDALGFDELDPDADAAIVDAEDMLFMVDELYASRKLYNYKMVAFDTAAEEFRWISSPPALTDPKSKIEAGFLLINAIQLVEIEGMLAMAIIDHRPGTMIHVWVLHDYVNEAWVQRYKIDLLAPAITANNDYDPLRYAPLYVVSQALHVLVPCPYALLQCDASGTVLQYHRGPHHWTICTGHLFEESFVLPAFLSAQGNDIEPPFFLFH